MIGILNGSVAIGSPKATLYDQRTKGPKIGMIGNGYIFLIKHSKFWPFVFYPKTHVLEPRSAKSVAHVCDFVNNPSLVFKKIKSMKH